jgi:hypothetical protein
MKAKTQPLNFHPKGKEEEPAEIHEGDIVAAKLHRDYEDKTESRKKALLQALQNNDYGIEGEEGEEEDDQEFDLDDEEEYYRRLIAGRGDYGVDMEYGDEEDDEEEEENGYGYGGNNVKSTGSIKVRNSYLHLGYKQRTVDICRRKGTLSQNSWSLNDKFLTRMSTNQPRNN